MIFRASGKRWRRCLSFGENINTVKTLLILLIALCWLTVRASEPGSVPTIRILPADIVQGSIEQCPSPAPQGTNKFMVRWTYTEAGARKMLAFWRAHAGQKVIEQIGGFEVRTIIWPTKPPGWTEEGWLKRRTDKFFGVSKEDAEKFLAGMEDK